MPLTSLQSELLLRSQLYLTLLSRNPSRLNLFILSLDLQPTWTISTLTFISPLFVLIICGCNLTIRGNRFDYCGLSDTQCGSMSSTHAAIHEAILRGIENGQCLKVTNRFLCLPSPLQRDTKITMPIANIWYNPVIWLFNVSRGSSFHVAKRTILISLEESSSNIEFQLSRQ